MWTFIRKTLLLYVLLLVALGAWLTRARIGAWEESLWVAIYPINADGSEVSATWVAGLRTEDFASIEQFMSEEAAAFGLSIDKPVRVLLGASVESRPPAPPNSANVLEVMLWSLQFRWWSWTVDKGADPVPADIVIYVQYHDPSRSTRLAHSLGLKEAQIGVVNAYASKDHRGSNQVITTHELLHTLGAVDHYRPDTNHPIYPQGYAEPEARPLYPQEFAEIMGGRIPLSKTESRIPRSLSEVIIGPATATLIGW